jgi:hypothetical protein
MSKKKVHILVDGQHDYVGKTNSENTKLKYSKNRSWSSHVRGTKVGEILDNGNGVNINCNDINLDLDYSDFFDLYTLLKLKVESNKKEFGKVKFLKNR